MQKQKTIRTSSLPRLRLCPGSYHAAKDLDSPKSPESESGDRVHFALQSYYIGVEFDEGRLDDRESMIFRWFRQEADKLIEKHGGAKMVMPELELENILPGSDILLTGHVDLTVECNDGIVLILDWKCGFLEVPPASENLQTTGYVWNFNEEAKKPCNEFTVDKIDSYLFSSGNEKAFTGARFTQEHIALSGNYIADVCTNAMDVNAPRNPSEPACKYCPAAGTDNCPESKEAIADAAISVGVMAKQKAELPADPLEVVTIFKAIKQVESIGRKFMPRLKEAIQDNPDQWADHFQLVDGNKVRTIIDVQGVYRKVVEGADLVGKDEFLSIVELSVGKLGTLLKEPLKDAGILVKNHDKYINDMLAEEIDVSQNKPSVKLIG